MGLFTNYRNIGKINDLIKQMEPSLNELLRDITYPSMANSNRIKANCYHVSRTMTEISAIALNSGNSVKLAPYYLGGRKLDLMQLSEVVTEITKNAERLI